MTKSTALVAGLLKSRAIVAALFVSLLVAVAGYASTVNASPVSSRCHAGKICFFVDQNYAGTMVEYQSIQSTWCYNIQVSMNDAISSIDNDTGKQIVIHKDSGCNNSGFNAKDLNVGDYWTLSGTGFNDETSSFYVK